MILRRRRRRVFLLRFVRLPFFLSFFSSSSSSPNCWHNTTKKFRVSEKRTHPYIYSEHWLCFLLQWSISFFNSNISLSIPRMCSNVSYNRTSTSGIFLRSHSFLLSFVKKNPIACLSLYDVQRRCLLKMNDYFREIFHRRVYSWLSSHLSVFHLSVRDWREEKVLIFNSTRTNPFSSIDIYIYLFFSCASFSLLPPICLKHHHRLVTA